MAPIDDFKSFVAEAEARRPDGTTDPASQYARWARDNPSEAIRWRAFRDLVLGGSRPAPPRMATHHGRELVLGGVLYLDATAPAPPPPPPPASGLVRGVSGGLYASLAQSCGARAFRDDAVLSGQPNSTLRKLAQWSEAQPSGSRPDVFAVCYNDMAAARAYPEACVRHCAGNEPWFEARGHLETFAVQAVAWARQLLAEMPGATPLFPVFTQLNSDNGDVQRADGSWAPYVDVVLDAAPEVPQVFRGVTTHPYAASPTAQLLDKAHARAVARGFDVPWHVTECGWTIGGGTFGVPDAAAQAANHRAMLDICRARPWIATYLAFCLQDVSTFQGWGLYDATGAARPAAAAVLG